MPRLLTIVVLVYLAACGGKSDPVTLPAARTMVGSIAVHEDRFPHALHTGTNPQIRNWQGRGLQCEDCHAAADVKAGRVARPGGNPAGPSSQQHAPCDDCHHDEFAKAPGPLCKVCHLTVDPTVKGSSTMKTFPAAGVVLSLASTFSHRTHLDAAKMEAAVGSHVSCTDCHARDATTHDPILPSHAQCLRCHEQAAAKAAVAMDKCDGCHLRRDVDIKRGRIFITGDLKFSHQTHETDRSGAAVRCTTCHENVSDSTKREDMAVPAMVRCAQCHEDAAKSPDRVRMSKCAVCHSAIQEGTPPTDHATTGAVPADHTLEFRKHHGDQAMAKDSNCRFCHQGLSGRREDSCFQCHQTMRPHDHNLMFRDDHGREAEADATRCGSCHQPETCTGCHAVPPRSHTPIADFRQGGHAQQARFNPTACLTCHTYATTCAQCHRGVR